MVTQIERLPRQPSGRCENRGQLVIRAQGEHPKRVLLRLGRRPVPATAFHLRETAVERKTDHFDHHRPLRRLKAATARPSPPLRLLDLLGGVRIDVQPTAAARAVEQKADHHRHQRQPEHDSIPHDPQRCRPLS